MKTIARTLILLLCVVPIALGALQEEPAPRVEITGVNATNAPIVLVTTNVVDPVGQPVRGLDETDFEIVGDLAGNAVITDVQNITDDQLTFAVVLVIDVSSSMSGAPIDRAKEAAQLFVDSIGPNDPVAVYTFSHDFVLVQDFTTDKPQLRAAIDTIQAGGRTGLYQGAFDAVHLAADAPSPRRAVILLSDGAEFGNASLVGRSAALEEATVLGVPVYTVGLGYGIDRSYLIELSEGTNARFVESPDPAQLERIYSDLAALLQSQYVITINADLPLDGTVFDLTLEVSTPFGMASDNANLRTPIPIPIVLLPELAEPLVEVTDIAPGILADDEIERVDIQIDGGDVAERFEAPYAITVDPETLAPGRHQIEISAIDAQGDVGTLSQFFEVGAMPPRVQVISNLDQVVQNVQTIQLEVTGQTPGVSATYSIDGERPMTDAELPLAFDIDPLTLTPGDHTLQIEVENEGGGIASLEVPFEVGVLSPYLVVVGVEEGQVVDAPTGVEVNVIATQTPVTDIDMFVNGTPLENTLIPSDAAILSTAEIDPMLFQPGAATLSVRAENESGGVSEMEVSFEIAALPPVAVIDNLREGDLLTENRDVGVSFISQTPVIHVATFLDGVDLSHRGEQPWNLTLDVLAMGPGAHTLLIAPQAANGQQSSVTINFTVSEAPALTATALVPTATPTPSNTPRPTLNVPATLTLEARVTQDAASTIAANTQVAQDATATERSFAATGTAEARATSSAIAVASAEAQATTDAQATQAQQAVLDAQATSVRATRSAQLTETAEARATENAQSTQSAGATATGEAATQAAVAMVATATGEARVTATQEARVTATQVRGTVLIFEKMFESRLFFVDKLIQMGARIVLCDPHRVVVVGPARLHGEPLSSPDIRAGMALLIAALAARGTSTIHNVAQIDRGYERLDERLQALGARIERVTR